MNVKELIAKLQTFDENLIVADEDMVEITEFETVIDPEGNEYLLLK